MPEIWTSTLVRLVLGLIAGALIGLIYDRPALGMLIVALGALAWHLYNLYRLERWLTTGSIADIPDGEGVWPPVFAKIQFIKTKAKRRGKRFRRLVKELRASTEAFPDGGVILNAQHEILNYNLAARVLLDLKVRVDRGQRIENLLRHPEFIAYLRSPGDRPAVEIPSPTGGDTWLSCRLIPYGPDQTLLLIRDISQRVKIERVRRDFVANASHELRTPLTVMMGYLDTLAEDPAKPPVWVQPIRVMQEQVQRMFRLVEDLLQLSRLESGQPVARDRAVSVADLIELARRDAQSLPGFGGQIEVQINSDVNVLGEESELQSVVSNLVANAVRYTPAEGRITISWNVDRDGGHLAVVDTGIGMSEADIPRVTERFYRADGGRARQSGGTGLGLSIVKYALRRHDADLEIRSRLGHGSTFICHF
ncbi:MAG: phosphate regulon sensor histidine kinase PhoR, partial [Gammaproteobacteria bacterium]|nr:phosphate regulon sensor histidine kinase PhoR [Gammaproteobacteria bacterium]